MNQTMIRFHERFRAGVLLAVAGGFLDAYTYLTRGGVFANAQTGNIVLLALNAAEGRFREALYYVVPILAFALGVLVTEYMKKSCVSGRFQRWEQFVLIVEILLLVMIGFLPEGIPDTIVNVTVSFICSLQVNTFRKVRNVPYASTMCTGNLRSGMEKLFRYLTEKDGESGRQAAHYFGIILAFMAGAAVGAFLVGKTGTESVWFCCIVLGLVLVFIMREEKKR